MGIILKWVLIYLIIWGLYRIIFKPALRPKTKKRPDTEEKRFEGKNVEEADFEEVKD